MAVRVVLGPAGSGKTELALNRLREYDMLSWCREVRLLVPTTEQAYRLRDRLIEQDDLPGLLGNPVCTFYDFASDIIAEAGLKAKLISDVQKRLALSDIVSSEKLHYFQAASTSPGFTDALDQIIGELKTSMVDPRDLEKTLDVLRDKMSPGTQAKCREILRLYQAYQQDILRKQEIHDREGVMWRALEILRDRNMLKRYKLFILDGFDQFTGVQKEFIRLASQHVPELMITLSYEPDRPEVFECLETAVQFVQSLDDVQTVQLERTQYEVNALNTLERNLFSPTPAVTPTDETITILESGNKRMEAEMVASEISRLARSGVSYDDIAVVSRDIESYYPQIADALTQHGIPFVEIDAPLAQTALARLVITALEISMSDWHRDHAFKALKSPFLSADPTTSHKVELRARQRGLVKGKDAWLEDWGTEEDTLEYRKLSLAPIAILDDELKQARSAVLFSQVLKKFVRNLKWREDTILASQDAAAECGIFKVLDELAATEEMIGRPLHRDHFRELFLSGVAAASIRTQDNVGNRVSLFKVESAAGQRFDVVFLGGMLEKVCPRQVREDPFFRDTERRLLNETLSGKLTERLSSQSRERFLFYTAVTSAEKRLYLSYPLSNSSAGDSMPSFYLEEVRKLYDGGNVKTIRRDVGDVVLPPWQAETKRGKLEGLVYGLASGEFDSNQLIGFYNSIPNKNVISGAISAASDREAVISDPRILAYSASQKRRFKPTELEDYASCPYKHFCAHVLGLQEVEDEVTGLNLGTILHEVLYKLFRSLRQKYGDGLILSAIPPADIIQQAKDLLHNAIEQDLMLVSLPGYLREMEERRLETALARFLQKEMSQSPTGFIPSFFEIEFGLPPREGRERDEGSIEVPLVLCWEGRQIEVCGKIDRIDVNPQSGQAVAVDYKLNKAPNPRDLEDGKRFQAPLYALAIERSFGLEPVGVEYKGIFKRDSSGFITQKSGLNGKKSDEEWLAWLRSCEERAVRFSTSIASCEIPILPEQDACTYCRFDSVCRIDMWKRLQLQMEDADAAQS